MLIAFSGIDSAGKSTQILKVVEYFKSRGRKTKVIWSRGGYTPLFNIFKSILRKITGDALPKPGASKHRDKTFNKKWVRLIWLDMALFDMTGDNHHDRHERVTHQGTFNGAPLSAAAGIALLKQVATGQPIERANAMSRLLHECWEEVLDRHAIAGYVYGPCSTFHVYFETDQERVKGVSRREELETTDPLLLKGMPTDLITSYQQHLRYRGVDLMSSS